MQKKRKVKMDRENLDKITEKENHKKERPKLEAKNKGQKILLNSIHYNDITIAMGPPGCGKSHVSVAYGCEGLLSGEINRIVLTRPTVFQGKGIGFLPGDINEKMNPYLVPMYDILKMYFSPVELTTTYNVGTSSFNRSFKIEIVPFEYMRGRNWFAGDYVILDEAQNATFEQIYTLLTRMCNNSKIIICGDISQRDVPIDRGIEHFIDKIKDIPGIGTVELIEQDIVRHRLVKEIIERLK